MREIASKYVEAGLSVLPANLSEKRPACGTWKELQDRLPTKEEFDGLFRRPCEAICIIAGRGSGNLEMLDFDLAGEQFEPWAEKIDQELFDRLVIERSQSGGWHVVYRCESEVNGNLQLARRRQDVAEKDIFIKDGQEYVTICGKDYKVLMDKDGTKYVILTLIETRGQGGVFLCDPSPGYTLKQGNFFHIPIITDEQREHLLSSAWQLNQYDPPESRKPKTTGYQLTTFESTGRPGDDYNRRADVPALLEAHGWKWCRDAADGNQHWTRPGKKRGTSGTFATLEHGRFFYCLTSSAAPLLQNQEYSPFHLYAVLEHDGDHSAAARQLTAEGYGDDGARLLPGVDISGILNPFSDDEEPFQMRKVEDPGKFPMSLLEGLPPLYREAEAFYRTCASEFQPVLWLASFIAASGAVLGHRLKEKSGNRTNIYTVGLLSSGGGKEATRGCAQRIFEYAGQEHYVGPEEFTSDAAVNGALHAHNPLLTQIDEFGRFMQCACNPASNPILYNIVTVFLKIFSKADGRYRTKGYSDTGRNKTIDQPHLCLYGTSVRDNFWTSMNQESIEGGFLPRIILFDSPEFDQPGEEMSIEPPARVVEWFRRWAIGTGDGGKTTLGASIVPFTDEATRLMSDLKAEERRRKNDTSDPLCKIWSRARENAGKLAMIHAAWKGEAAVCVQADSMQWATQVVRHCIERMTFESSKYVTNSKFEAMYMAVWRRIHAMEGHSIRQRDLNQVMKEFKPRERNEIMEVLIAQGRLVEVNIPTKGRSAKGWMAV